MADTTMYVCRVSIFYLITEYPSSPIAAAAANNNWVEKLG